MLDAVDATTNLNSFWNPKLPYIILFKNKIIQHINQIYLACTNVCGTSGFTVKQSILFVFLSRVHQMCKMLEDIGSLFTDTCFI